MLDQLHIQHFTVFQDAHFEFSPGLNVFIGDNGTGKTHVLKLGYLFSRAWQDLMSNQRSLGKKRAESYFEERLVGLFRIADLGILVSQGYKNGSALYADLEGHIPTISIHMPWEKPSSPGLPERMLWDIRLKRLKDQAAQVEALQIPDDAASNAYLSSSLSTDRVW